MSRQGANPLVGSGSHAWFCVHGRTHAVAAANSHHTPPAQCGWRKEAAKVCSSESREGIFKSIEKKNKKLKGKLKRGQADVGDVGWTLARGRIRSAVGKGSRATPRSRRNPGGTPSVQVVAWGTVADLERAAVDEAEPSSRIHGRTASTARCGAHPLLASWHRRPSLPCALPQPVPPFAAGVPLQGLAGDAMGRGPPSPPPP